MSQDGNTDHHTTDILNESVYSENEVTITMTATDTDAFDPIDTFNEIEEDNPKRPSSVAPESSAMHSSSDTVFEQTETPVRGGKSLQPMRFVTNKSECTSTYEFKTKLGTLLSKLLEKDNQAVINLDKAKHSYKQNPRSKPLKAKYLELESSISALVLQLHGQCDKQIRKWEQIFLTEHMRFPTKVDICKDHTISVKYKQKHMAEELLQYWNITVHK